MTIADIDGRVSRVLFSEVNGEYHNLYYRMFILSEELINGVFEKDFGKDYGRMFHFTGHIYVPDHDLTMFMRPSELMRTMRKSDGNLVFNQRWSIMGDKGIWADALLHVDSCLDRVDAIGFEVFSAGRMEMGRLRMCIEDFLAKLEVGKRGQ